VTSDTLSVELDKPITFRTLDGAPLAARGVSLELTAENGVPAAKLVFRVEPALYDKIVDQWLFGLLPEVRGEPMSPFSADEPIEIEARLRPELASAVVKGGRGARELVEGLLGTSTTMPFVAITESWQVLSVVQAMALPAGTEGTIQSGYRTTIGGGTQTQTEPSMLKVARRAAERAGTPMSDAGNDLQRFIAKDGALTWTVLVWIDEEKRSCAVFSVAPDPVPAERRAAVAEYLVDRNYYLTVGAFEMDLDDGEVRFRTSIDATNMTFDEACFVNLVSANLSLFGLFQEPLRGLAAGRLTLDEARGLHT
jgi:hypothetical protein